MWLSHRNLDRSGTVGAKAELGWILKSGKGKWKQEDWMCAFLLRSFAKKESNAMGLGNRWGVKWSFPFERWELHYRRVLMKKIKRKESTDVPGQGGLGLGLGSTDSSWSFVWIHLREGSQHGWLVKFSCLGVQSWQKNLIRLKFFGVTTMERERGQGRGYDDDYGI